MGYFDKRIEAFEKGKGKEFMNKNIPFGMTIDPSSSFLSNIPGYETYMKDKNLGNIFTAKGNGGDETKVTPDKSEPPKFQDIFDKEIEAADTLFLVAKKI